MSNDLQALLQKIREGTNTFQFTNGQDDSVKFDELVEDILYLEQMGWITGVVVAKNFEDAQRRYNLARVGGLTRLGIDELTNPWWKRVGLQRLLGSTTCIVGIFGSIIWILLDKPWVEPSILLGSSIVGLVGFVLWDKRK